MFFIGIKIIFEEDVVFFSLFLFILALSISSDKLYRIENLEKSQSFFMISRSLLPSSKISWKQRLGDTLKKKIRSSSNFLLSCRQMDPGFSFFSFETLSSNPIVTVLTGIETEELNSDYFDSYYFNEICNIEIIHFKKKSEYFSTLSQSYLENLKYIKPVKRYQYLWVTCEVCEGINYRKDFLTKLYICQYCDSYVRMGSSERIDCLIDSGTWYPMDEDMISLDPIEFDQKNQIDEVKQFDHFFLNSKEYKKFKILKMKTYRYPDISQEVLFFKFLELPLSIFLMGSFSPFNNSPRRVYNLRSFHSIRYLDHYLKKIDLKIKKSFFLKEEKKNHKKKEDKYTYKKEKRKYSSIDTGLRHNRKILIEINRILKELNKIINRGIPDEDQKELDHKNKKRGVARETPYIQKIDFIQREYGLTEAVQTGVGMLNGIPIAMGVMDFRFIGGSMGTVVGEKITRLIEYAGNERFPLIIVCASGGARMQEGSLSLMQMAKISSALHHYQSSKKLFFISVLTSPTTGGVIASFAMLADIIIAEPEAHIAFAGKRVIEQTLNQKVPDGSQEAEMIFDSGLLDLIVPRNLLKGVLNELVHLHI
uniref:Acetyl-coenzyme A carboxylase carboxyl transferase subunit beta, chloroplastic n=1 Tax=Marathrum utile TaxID=995772 RepID=A0A8K1JU70_9ROSI|nr:Acetyl-coenzyme A carboxylase carboxyl transferase subunit beta [Marathrum utile]UCU20293.1 Acetyl-coenzyme A carboxylase carboxyl transferase subunit beta [Marathrum utile]